MIHFEGRNRGGARRFPPEVVKEFNGRLALRRVRDGKPNTDEQQVYVTTQMSSELQLFSEWQLSQPLALISPS